MQKITEYIIKYKRYTVVLGIALIIIGAMIYIPLYNESTSFTAKYELKNSSITSDEITLRATRVVFYFPLGIPSTDPTLYLNLELSYSTLIENNSLVVIQYSYDKETWGNLSEREILDGDGSTRIAIKIYSFWAKSGIIYIRAILINGVEVSISNIIDVLVREYTISPLLCFVGAIILLGFSLLVSKKEHITDKQNEKEIKSKLKKALLYAFAIRIILAPLTEHRYDMYIYRLASALYLYGDNPFYPGIPQSFPGVFKWAYPPLYFLYSLISFAIFVISTAYKLPTDKSTLWGGFFEGTEFYDAYMYFIPPRLPILDTLLKLPLIGSDLIISLVLIKLLDNKNYAIDLIKNLWLFNPYVIFISSVWGMFDPLASMFSIVALYFFAIEEFFAGGIFLGLGFLTKMYPAFYFPPIFLYLLLRKEFRKAIKSLIGFLAVSFLTIPIYFALPNGLDALLILFKVRSVPDWRGKFFAKGLSWQVFITWFFPNAKAIPVFLILFIPLYGMTITYFIIAFRKNMFTVDNLARIFVSITALEFLTYNFLNPQYFYWMLPLLILLLDKKYIRKKDYKIYWMTVLIAVYLGYPITYFISAYFLLHPYSIPVLSEFEALRIATYEFLRLKAIPILIVTYLNFYFYSKGVLPNAMSGLNPITQLIAFRKYVLKLISSKKRIKQIKGKKIHRRFKVSIGINAYNEGLNLVECVNSILKDNKGFFDEIIIVAGGTDNTIELAKRFESAFPDEIRVIEERERRGKIWGINQILKRASGDIIILCAGDAIVERKAIRYLVEPFYRGYSNLGVVTSKPKPIITTENRLIRNAIELLWELHNEVIAQTYKHLGSAPHASAELMAFKAGEIREIPSDVVNDDAYIANYFVKKGYRIIYQPKAIVYVRTPETVMEYLQQRRRIQYGHYKVSKELGTVSGAFLKVMYLYPSIAFIAIKNLLIRRPEYLFYFVTTALLEIIAILIAQSDHLLKVSHAKWKLIESTKGNGKNNKNSKNNSFG